MHSKQVTSRTLPLHAKLGMRCICTLQVGACAKRGTGWASIDGGAFLSGNTQLL
jgi:hypothetical protein